MSSRIFGMGIDLIDLDRIRAALNRYGEAFALRICTPAEWAYCCRHHDPVPFLAARFAAKEAVAKALGTGIGARCSFTEVEISRGDTGQPYVVLFGRAAETACNLGIGSWLISLTHSSLSASATAIAIADERPDPVC